MIFNQRFLKVQPSGKNGLVIPITTHARELGIIKGEKLYVYCVETDGKRRIIIERID